MSLLPAITTLAVPHDPNRIMVCQVSRGVAPALAVAEVVAAALRHGAGYTLVAGYPLVEAKNHAVAVADAARADLVLCEDDVLAEPALWPKLIAANDTVRVTSSRCRNGTPNTKYDAAGTVLTSGNVLVTLPHAVLDRLPRPVFAASCYGIASDGELFLRSPDLNGRGSDTHLWAQIRALKPRPTITVIGEVQHLLHPLNRERWELQIPCEVSVA